MSKEQGIRYANLTKHFAMKSRMLHIPFSGTFELTPRCNMNCKMCYIRMSEEEMKKVGSEMPVDEWIRIAREAVDAGMTMALLTGGEAIMYRDFKKFYLALRKMGVFVSINTNGTMLTGKWLDFFQQYPPAKFNITIYGGSNETYQRLCGNPKGFDQLKSGIEALQARNIEILLNCTISKQNACDIENMIQFAEEHELKIHAATYNFPPVRKEGVDCPELCRADPTQAAASRIRLNWYTTSEKDQFWKRAERLSEMNFDDLDSDSEDSCGVVEGDRVLCAAGRSNFWITWDGRMLPCGMIPDFGVTLQGRSFLDAWHDVVSHTENIRLAPECKNCKKKTLCTPCAAKLKSETGRYDQKSDYMCQYVDEYIRLLREGLKQKNAEENN